MSKFYGTWDELKDVVGKLRLKGIWKEPPNMKQFRTSFGAILNWYPSTCTLVFGGPDTSKGRLQKIFEDSNDPLLIRDEVDAPAQTERAGDSTEIFVVHGRDHEARDQLELILHRLGLKPFVLMNTSGGGNTLIEALEEKMRPGPDQVRFGIVLLTPDDLGRAKTEDQHVLHQRARQNVVFEFGMLSGSLGRGSVAVLHTGQIELPSNVRGLIYIPYEKHVKEAVPKLVDHMTRVGIKLQAADIARCGV